MPVFLIKVSSLSMLRLLLCAMFFFLVAAQSGMIMAEGSAAAPTLEISFHDGLISANLVNAPLIDVLQRIQQEYGFKAHFHGDLTEPITLVFTDMPLQKCLRQLTVNQSLSVASRPTKKTLENNDAKQIAEIWVLSRSTAAQTAKFVPAAPIMPAPNSIDGSVNAGEDTPGQVVHGQGENEPADQSLNRQQTEESNKRETLKNLAAISDPASVLAIAEFSHDADREIRQLSVSAIGSVDSVASTHILGQVLRDEPDAEIRKIAVRALGQRQQEATAKTFLEGALNDADAGVKTLAQQLLAE